MTPDPRTALEQVAREWLIARGWCHLDASYQRVPVQGDVLALVDLLAAQRVAVLEEVAEHFQKSSFDMVLSEGVAMWCRQQAQEEQS